MNLPNYFIETVTGTFEGGAEWLAELSSIIAQCEVQWGLKAHEHFPTLSYNYAAPATMADGTAVVLKIGVPRDELATEMEALRIYNGRAICRLIDADMSMGVLILEWLKPGKMLIEVKDDDEATRIAAQVMQKLWRPLPETHSFPSVADWSKGLLRLRETFAGGTGPFSKTLVETAESIFSELLAENVEPVLLHGDLHHYNILSAEREPWLAIDPKGVVGEPAYEVGAFLHNPLDLMTWPDWQTLIPRRLDILAETLQMDRQRLVALSLAQDVLSNWWDYEDMGQVNEMPLAELLLKEL